MIQVTADEMFDYARSLDGRELRTIHQGKSFTVGFDGKNLTFTPGSGKVGKHERKYLEQMCKQFSRTNSLKQSDYKEATFKASYMLTLIVMRLASKSADGQKSTPE